jgi:16S rRNA (guanine527-N7)-methyltransferase
MAHAEELAACVDEVRLHDALGPVAHPQPSRVLDLGSGGGLPGLVLAEHWRDSHVVLLDSNERKTAFLEEAVCEIGFERRVEVLRERAESAGRRTGLKNAFELVVARSFGPPAVTAECAAPFLVPGGLLVVSEPPSDAAEPSSSDHRREGGDVGFVGLKASDPRRWPSESLLVLGLQPMGKWNRAASFQVLRQVRLCPDRFPRRVGVVTKRPLYST